MKQQDRKYSIWLRPSQAQIDGFTRIISRLSHRHRTSPFPAHITIASSVGKDLEKVRDESRKITEKTCSFSIDLKAVEYTQAYFRNLYISVENNQALSELHTEFKTILTSEIDEAFIPHLSLLYGNLRADTQKDLQNKLAGKYPASIECDRIDIYDITGKESQWYLIESFKLKSE